MANFTQRKSGNWQAKIRRKGWPDQSKAFQTLAAAQQWARATEREMDIGAFVNTSSSERTTFSEACDKFAFSLLVKHCGQKASKLDLEGCDFTAASIKEKIIEAKLQDALLVGLQRSATDLSRIALLKIHFGKYSLAALSPVMISNFRDARLKIMSEQTVKHELNLISRILKACVFDWGIALPQGIPTALVRKPTVSNARDRRLEPGEWELLRQALSECHSQWPLAIVEFAIETAARQSEIASLTWQDVFISERRARLRGIDGGPTKNGDTYRDVPLSSRAIEVLSSLPRPINGSGKVFHITQNALKRSCERAVDRARQTHLHNRLTDSLIARGKAAEFAAGEIRALIYGKKTPATLTLAILADIESKDKTLVDLRFHDYRHEACSRLAEGGKLQMHELMKVTGHKSSSMVARYYHPRASDLAAKLG